MDDLKKYELTEETRQLFDRTVYRIRALRDFGKVYAGQLGGWIEREANLSHDGNAWVEGNAMIVGNAKVEGDALISGNARVEHYAIVCGRAHVSGTALICGGARIFDTAYVAGDATVDQHAKIYGTSSVCGNANISGYAKICGNVHICGDANIYGNAYVCDDDAVFWIEHIGPNNSTMTFFTCRDGEVKLVHGNFYGGLDKFFSVVAADHVAKKYTKTYQMAVEMAKVRLGGEKDE